MVFVNAFIKQFLMSSIKLRFKKNYTHLWRSSKKNWINGLNAIITKKLIKAKCVVLGHLLYTFIDGLIVGKEKNYYRESINTTVDKIIEISE